MKPIQGLILLSLIPLTFLGACSSGGGGGSTLPSQPAAITPANATEVAAGMPMTVSLVEFQEFMGFETLTAEGTGTTDCPSGGSITAGFDVDTVPVGEVSTGDRFSVTFQSCMLDDTSRITGGIVIDFNTVDGDWETDDTWEVDIDFAINDLTFSSGPATGRFDGDWSQNVSYDMGDSSFSLAGEFTTSINDGSGWLYASLSDVTLTCNYDASAAEGSYTVDGQFASTEMGGIVTITTLIPMTIQDGALNPHEGMLRAHGADDSRLTFTVLDDTFVRLDVDEDGDGIDEFSVTTTWDELND